MIDALIEALTATIGPDRELDCGLHEVLTGQLDEQKDNEISGPRELNRQHGEMLLDLGAERKRVRIPPYTQDFDTTVKHLLPAGLALKVSMSPPAVLAGARQVMPNVERWVVSLWKPETNGQVGYGTHRNSAAIALCLALLKHAKEHK